MRYFLQFIIIGIGLGSSYALFAQGAVLIYRGSGIVNFAHGSLGMVAAYVTYLAGHRDAGLPIGVCVVMGIAAAVLVGALFQLLVLNRLTRAAPITRLIATLGLLGLLRAVIELRYGGSNREITPFVPHGVWDWGGVKIQHQALTVIVIAFIITISLWLGMGRTRTGMAITAISENERATQTLGWSPTKLSIITWSIGSAVAGVAGVLIAPMTGLSPVGFTVVVTVTSLAAAVLGGFRSFPLTLCGGIVVGMGESMVTGYRPDIEDFIHQHNIPGMSRGVAFVAILIALAIRGKALPLRSHRTDRLPNLGSGQLNLRAAAIGSVAVLVMLLGVFDRLWATATIVSASGAVVVLSVVVLTGYAGQLSLAQYALAGIGALLSAMLHFRFGWSIGLAVPAGVLLTVPAGLVFALPALRTRGVSLAIATLAMGFTVREVLLANGPRIARPQSGQARLNMEFFGTNLDGVTHPHRYATVCIVAFMATAIMVANLRRSRTGRRLIAVRTNERAAASMGISVLSVKLYAFAVSAGIAGLGGVLIAFRAPFVTFDQFNIFASIDAVGFAVIGGIGFVTGAMLSAPLAGGGLLTRILEDVLSLGRYEAIVTGLILFTVMIVDQNGAAAGISRLARASRAAMSRPRPQVRPPLTAATTDPVMPATLTIANLTVRFGGVLAVDDASFEVKPGEVVGLIGPNGAGKTTIIDAVTGFVRPSAGTFTFGDRCIDTWGPTRRAQQGLRRSFQSLELFENSDVEDNIRAGADRGSRLSWLTDLVWPGTHPLPSTAIDAIHQFDLEGDLGKFPGELSNGRQRLVGIARSIASAPSVIMLDEPAAGLDEHESRELAALIRNLAHDRRMGVLLVEHDVGLVMATCDRIVVLEFGRVIAQGTPTEIRSDPAVVRAYLGAEALC